MNIKRLQYFQSVQKTIVDNFIKCYGEFFNISQLNIYSDTIELIIDDNATKCVYSVCDDILTLEIYTRVNTKTEYSLYDTITTDYNNRCKLSYKIRDLYFDVTNSTHTNTFSIKPKY